MQILQLLNIILGSLFLLCYAYQAVYLVYSMIKKPKTYPDSPQTNRYAILICGRNEEKVIGQLLDSIRAQDYPQEQIRAFVCADNCDDRTADVARRHGAEVYERHNTEKIGKGYALQEILRYIAKRYGEDAFDGYLVVDADNLLTPNYLTEMDKCFSAGNRIVTGYRNTKNFGDNWLSSAYGMWFLHEARQLNNARSLLGVSGAVSGTGFLMHKDIVKRMGGWNYFLLIEDVEFSVDMILSGEHIAYCHAAMLYDEQPTSLKQSWNQRLRWCRGYIQVMHHYGWRLIKKICSGSFSAFDMLMNIAPAYFFATLLAGLNTAMLITAVVAVPGEIPWVLLSVAVLCLGGYLWMFSLALCAAITEKDFIRATKGQIVKAVLTFPLFILSFIPIAIAALFCPHVGWKPIAHCAAVSLEEVQKEPTAGEHGLGHAAKAEKERKSEKDKV